MHPAYGIGGVLLLSVILISALHFSGYEYFDPDDHEQVERRNRTRIAALEPGADTVAVGCPFCSTMVTDGLAAIDVDMQVQDVAEMVWAQIKANDAAIKANKAAAETTEEVEA